jgi:hypothetical protein
MGSTYQKVTYRFQFALTGGGDTEYSNLELTSPRGVDDSYALALAKAMVDVMPPTGVTTAITVQRDDSTDIVTAGDLNATPPAFS